MWVKGLYIKMELRSSFQGTFKYTITKATPILIPITVEH